MANWDTHKITAVGSPQDILRIAQDYKIECGKIDAETQQPVPAYGGKPRFDMGPGRYFATSCRVGIFDIEIDLEMAPFPLPTDMFYSHLRTKYPTIHFTWRYWLEMDWGCGYIDDIGDHRWHENSEGNFVLESWSTPPGSIANPVAVPLVDEVNPEREISPEAMSDDQWARHLISLGPAGWEYFRHLRETNGSTDNPPDNQVVIWGLRHNDSGRWVGNKDLNGVVSLLVFLTHDLAARFVRLGLTVVWMNVVEWWKKVQDAAETGFPTNVNLLYGVTDGSCNETSFSCRELTASPVALMDMLQDKNPLHGSGQNNVGCIDDKSEHSEQDISNERKVN